MITKSIIKGDSRMETFEKAFNIVKGILEIAIVVSFWIACVL
jgi:hypothetical protein